jgi:hypothetical protein
VGLVGLTAVTDSRGRGGYLGLLLAPGKQLHAPGPWAFMVLEHCHDANFIEHVLPSGQATPAMKLRLDQTLRFWVDVAYDEIKLDHIDLTKRQQLLAHILRQYERLGHAMRYLDVEGKIAWKASPRFLTMLADAERDAQDELEEFP